MKFRISRYNFSIFNTGIIVFSVITCIFMALFVLSPNGRPLLSGMILLLFLSLAGLFRERQIAYAWIYISEEGVKFTCFRCPEYKIGWNEEPKVYIFDIPLSYGYKQKWIYVSKQPMSTKRAKKLGKERASNDLIRIQYTQEVYDELVRYVNDSNIIHCSSQ